LKNKENIKINAYAVIKKLKEYPKFDYREAMRALFYTYQNSSDWNYVRKAVKERDNNTCQDCGKKDCKLIVHHEKYDNWGYGDFREIKDCVLLCEKCHNKRHRNFSVDVPFWAMKQGGLNKVDQEAVNDIEKLICL
jgi:hypothetical protein